MINEQLKRLWDKAPNAVFTTRIEKDAQVLEIIEEHPLATFECNRRASLSEMETLVTEFLQGREDYLCSQGETP